MTPTYDKHAQELLAELDDARDTARRTKRAYRYVNMWAPLLFAVGLTVWVVGSTLYDGPRQGFSILAAWLLWMGAGLCIARCITSCPRDGEYNSMLSIHQAQQDIRDAERAFNHYVMEQQ